MRWGGQFRPYRALGGSQNYRNSKAKTGCKKGIPSIRISPGNSVFASKKTTTKVTGGASMSDFGLDTSQANNSSNKKKFTNKGTKEGGLCGNNNTVANATIVREVA